MTVLSDGKSIVVTATGIKLGRAGRLLNTPTKVQQIVPTLEKGDRRKVRKALRAAGRPDLSRL